MNEPMMNEGIWPTWLQQSVWLEWLQPVLYALLAIALISLVFVLLDLALLCWKEFHTETQAHPTTAPGHAAGHESGSTTPVIFAKRQDRSKVILLRPKAGTLNRGIQSHQQTQQTTAQR